MIVKMEVANTDPRKDRLQFSAAALREMAIELTGRPIDLHGAVHVVTRSYVETEAGGRAILIVEAEA